MIELTDPSPKSIRSSITLDPALHERLRRAAAACDQSLVQFVRMALARVIAAETERRDLISRTATADPVLAELWDNPHDAAYDHM